MSTLEEIGGVLGFVAFAGVAVLIFLTFQQARHVRRLREWAGRAPERAVAAAEREDEIAAEVTQVRADPDEPEGPSRVDVARESAKLRYAELDRRLPVDPKIVAGGLIAVLLGVGVATSGFGILGDDEAGSGGTGSDKEAKEETAPVEKPDEPLVAVLNASGSVPGQPGTPGLADTIAGSVEDAGYELGKVTNADSLPISVVMFAEGADETAAALATDLEPVLGTTETIEMTEAISGLAGQADLAVVIGFDDAGV